MGKNKIPYIVTHDGRTIRYPHPDIKRHDTVKVSTFNTYDFFPILYNINLFSIVEFGDR